MAGLEDLFKSMFELKGVHREPYDQADILYEPRKDTIPSDAENLRKDARYQSFWGPIYDQGPVQSCVANAAAALLSFELKKSLAAATDKHLCAINPSRSFIWYNARREEVISKLKTAEQKEEASRQENLVKEKAENATCHTRSAMKTLQRDGVCDEKDCEYPTKGVAKYEALNVANAIPSEPARETAKGYRIQQYERVDKKRSPEEMARLAKLDATQAQKGKDDDGELVITNVRAAITEGHPVQFGIHYYYKELEQQYKLIDTAEGKRWSLAPLLSKHVKPKAGCGSHCVLAVGYDKDFVVCQNSYGEDCECNDGGFFLVPWAWISDFEATEDFWIMRGFQRLPIFQS